MTIICTKNEFVQLVLACERSANCDDCILKDICESIEKKHRLHC